MIRSVISEKAYQKLRRMIYRGQLPPGSRIVERDLAARLGVSRIPLRESLARLAAEGLVRTIPNSATYVADLSTNDILEIYSMRLLLEPLAARLATLRDGKRLAKQLDRLRKQMAIHAKEVDIPKLNEVEYQFHFAIVRASHHSRLVRAYECAHVQILDRGPAQAIRAINPPTKYVDEHGKIVDCIASGDAEGAEREASDHIHSAMKDLEKIFGVQFDEVF